MSLTSAAVVALLAFIAPLIVRVTRLPVPDIVIQILLGVVVGPYVLGWARADEPVRVLALIGLSFLLFLAGLEINFDRLRGRVATLAFGGYLLSVVLALIVGNLLAAAHLVPSPLLIAIILSATALGVVLPARASRPRTSRLVRAGLLSSAPHDGPDPGPSGRRTPDDLRSGGRNDRTRSHPRRLLRRSSNLPDRPEKSSAAAEVSSTCPPGSGVKRLRPGGHAGSRASSSRSTSDREVEGCARDAIKCSSSTPIWCGGPVLKQIRPT